MGITLAQTQHIELVHTGEIAAGGGNSEKSVNVWHYKRTAFVLTVSKAAVFNAWKAAIGDKIILALSERYVSQNVKIRIIDDPEDKFSLHSFTDPGAIAGESLPSHHCVLMNLKTATRGRYAQGRKFFSPIAEADHEDDVMDASGIALWDTVKTAVLTGFTDATGNVWKSQIVSKFYSDLTTSPAYIESYEVNEVVVNKTLAILTGRRSRVVT